MKRIILLLLIVLSFTGCSRKQDNVDIDANSIEEKTDLQIGFGLQNIETGYVYDGNEISVNFDYEVGGRDSKLGLMIYVNGIPQILKNDDDDVGMVYKFDGKKDSKETSNIKFVPNTGQVGDVLTMHGILISDCEIVDKLISMQNKQHLVVCGSTTLKINAVPNAISIDDSLEVDYGLISSELIEKYKDRDDYFNQVLLMKFTSNSDGTFNQGESIPLEIVGKPNIYRVWILEDLIPTQSFYVDLKGGNTASMNIALKNKETKNIKAVAIPLNNEFPEQSESLVRQ